LPTVNIDRGKPSSFRKKMSRASSFRKQRSVKGRKNGEAGGGRYAAGVEDNKIIPDIPGDIERNKQSILSYILFVSKKENKKVFFYLHLCLFVRQFIAVL
jgi:hypothetical protein